jgi:hypothetical protein
MRNSTIVCAIQAGKTALDMTNRFFKINSFGLCAYGSYNLNTCLAAYTIFITTALRR